MPTRTLVLGGNGFIGSHTVDALADAGHDVTAFDREFTRPESAESGVSRVTGDLGDRALLADLVAGSDVVIHLAGASTPASSDADPVGDIVGPMADTVGVLDVVAAARAPRLIFASTGGAMYGSTGTEPATESTLPEPVSPYAIGKLAVEGYLRYYRAKHGLRSVVLRISNPYGPRQRLNRGQGVIASFLTNIAEERPITVYGDGSMVRDYVYVDDVAAMIAAVADTEPAHALYHVASGTGTSITELIAIVARVTGREVRIDRLAKPATFVDRVVLDIGRFSSEFGLTPAVTLEDGIAATWRARIEGVE